MLRRCRGNSTERGIQADPPSGVRGVKHLRTGNQWRTHQRRQGTDVRVCDRRGWLDQVTPRAVMYLFGGIIYFRKFTTLRVASRITACFIHS